MREGGACVVTTPEIQVPPGVRTDWTSVEARVVMIRGLIETCGPIVASEVARRLHVTERQAFATLEALEGEGLVLRGRFENVSEPGERAGASPRQVSDDDMPGTVEQAAEVESGVLSQPTAALLPGASAHPLTDAPPTEGLSRLREDEPEIEWCHRRLLSRIHRLTINGLRQQIEPVDVTVFWRFLFEHHEIGEKHAREGVNAVFDAVAKLQGVEVPAAAWEQHVLAARVANYRSAWLDELCLNGEVGWGRLSPVKVNPESNGTGTVTKVAPMSVWLRGDLDWLRTCSDSASIDGLSESAAKVFETIKDSGAVFAADLLRETQLPLPELRGGLSELANRGLLTSDGFAGLRSLVKVAATEAEPTKRRVLTRSRSENATKGRWSLWREPGEINEPTDEDVEQWAWQLLRRWGVVFRDVLNRESNTPRWYRLLQAFRRLEARGEIRGGRFITGVAGEQFATADTVKRLRQLRIDGSQPSGDPKALGQENIESRRQKTFPNSQTRVDDGHSDSEVVVLSAADPLNLVGIITSDPKVPKTSSNKIAFLNGVPVAALNAGEVVPIGCGKENDRVYHALLPGTRSVPV